MEITVAIDCMGGDHGPHVTVPAALNFLKSNSNVDIVLVGLRDAIEAELRAGGARSSPRLRVHPASEVVLMGEAQACVSAGNTGALMAVSRFVLKTLPGIDRPAIIAALPSTQGSTYVLDLGANVDCGPEHLLQFAIMGATLVAAVEHKDRPSVGLLNIGEEDIKGNEVVKKAAELLRASEVNFIGNIEGGGIYKGEADVVVCDGFVGNVMLKASEGMVQMVRSFIRQEFMRSVIARLAGVIVMPAIYAFRKRLDPRRFNGATLLGLKGIVVKSHGSADVFGFERAIERAMEEVRNEVLHRLMRRFGQAERGNSEEAA